MKYVGVNFIKRLLRNPWRPQEKPHVTKVHPDHGEINPDVQKQHENILQEIKENVRNVIPAEMFMQHSLQIEFVPFTFQALHL